MRAVYVQLPEGVLAERRRTGADQWDEVWEGVLHIVPSPDFDHQNLEGSIEHWLRTHWTPWSKGCVAHQINVSRPGLADWRRDYRIPDLVLLLPERFAINRNECFAGGPDAVVEIRSPEDETYDKIPFYAAIGVRELWVIDRDTRAVEVHDLAASPPRLRAAGADGWVRSALGVELRATAERKLQLRLGGDDATLGIVP